MPDKKRDSKVVRVLQAFRGLSPVHLFALIALFAIFVIYMQVSLEKQRQEIEARNAITVSQLIERLHGIQATVIQLSVEKARLEQVNTQLQERVRFLEECLRRPTPWPGQRLCPNIIPQEGSP